jgi:hypothetical protein
LHGAYAWAETGLNASSDAIVEADKQTVPTFPQVDAERLVWSQKALRSVRIIPLMQNALVFAVL